MGRYQHTQSQPMTVFNVGNQINFEARILNENENPNEILIQHRTMFFDNRKGKLYIKEINGDLDINKMYYAVNMIFNEVVLDDVDLTFNLAKCWIKKRNI